MSPLPPKWTLDGAAGGQRICQLSCFGRRYHTITRTNRQPMTAVTNVAANAQLLSAISALSTVPAATKTTPAIRKVFDLYQ